MKCAGGDGSLFDSDDESGHSCVGLSIINMTGDMGRHPEGPGWGSGGRGGGGAQVGMDMYLGQGGVVQGWFGGTFKGG